LIVLADGGCYSTTEHFCALLKTHTNGIFIGDETGGFYACNGGFKEHRLRISGLELLLPYATFITNAQGLDRGRGIVPDYVVAPSIHDLLNNTDPAMKTEISLIRDDQK
jgi:C-terminal processing protease CtpA/Prc